MSELPRGTAREAEELAAAIDRKRVAGGAVVLSADMAESVQAMLEDYAAHLRAPDNRPNAVESAHNEVGRHEPRNEGEDVDHQKRCAPMTLHSRRLRL